MKTHYLNVEKVSKFEDIYNFFYKGEISNGDEVVVDEGTSGYDFVHRQVMYGIFREALHRKNYETQHSYYTPLEYKILPPFFETTFFADTLTKDTGITFKVVKGNS